MSEAVSYEDYLREHGSLTYTNVGTSMLPLLRQGRDLFTVVPKVGRCRVGDVALYRRPPNRWVLHRVVAVVPDGYLMLGDNCMAREHVLEDDVLAVMCGYVRDGRDHRVDELGYRVYTKVLLVTEAPRVALRRVWRKARCRLAGRLRHA